MALTFRPLMRYRKAGRSVLAEIASDRRGSKAF